jgi:rubrerythrin
MEQHDFINGCIKVENTVASIYSRLMQVLPKQKEFWEGLLNDEREHIAFLSDVKTLGLVTELEKMNYAPSMNEIKKTLKLTDSVTRRISDDPISMKNALKLALKLEESMVETYANELIAKLLSCDDESSYKKLLADEKKHIDKVRKMMKKA